MIAQCRSSLMLFVVFVIAAIPIVGPYVVVLESAVLAAAPESQSATGADDESRETKRIDLGEGLELVETTFYREGKLAARVKTYKRAGTLIMAQYSVSLGATDTINYYRHGKAILSEFVDKDEHLMIVSDENGTPIEVYERHKDGTTAPVSSKKLRQLQKEHKFMEAIFAPIANAAQHGDEAKALKHVDDAIERASNRSRPGE